MSPSPEAADRALPRLHIVTDDGILATPRFRETVERLMRAGGRRVAVHLRGRGTSGRAIWEHAAFCAPIAREAGASLIVNDRVDIALGIDSDGVQLGAGAIPIRDARTLLGSKRLIGASVHDRPGAGAAAREGADFLVVGTLYVSASHPDRRPSGVAWLAGLGDLGLPVIGIGGVRPEHVCETLDAGAHGVAVIRGIWGARSPAAAMEDYLMEFDRWSGISTSS